MTRSLQTFRMEWRGIAVEIQYEADWLGTLRVGRLAVVTPERATLPIATTGYRSAPVTLEEIACVLISCLLATPMET